MMKPTGEGPRFKSKDEILAECANGRPSPRPRGLSLLLQGGAGSNTFLALKNAGVKDSGCTSALEMNGARPVAADRRGSADGCPRNRQSGIERACFLPPGGAKNRRAVEKLSGWRGDALANVRRDKGRTMSIFDDPFDSSANSSGRAVFAASTAPPPSTITPSGLALRAGRAANQRREAVRGVVASAVIACGVSA